MNIKLSQNELLEKKHFNKTANEYDDNYKYQTPFSEYKLNKKTSEFVALIQPILKKNKKIEILEIGCGTGEYTKRVAKLLSSSQKMIGLDISDKIVNVAKKKCKDLKNVSFVTESAYKTSFRKNSIDVVFGFYVLHHLDVNKLKKELLRILKPGGVVFFYEPNLLNPVVFLIKSSRFLKERVGDSPNESAINPVTITAEFEEFKKLKISTSEFIWPLNFIPLGLLIKIDKLTSNLSQLPLIKYLAGSVQIFLQKK